MKSTDRRPTRRQPLGSLKQVWIGVHGHNRLVIFWPFSSRKWELADITDPMIGVQFGRGAA